MDCCRIVGAERLIKIRQKRSVVENEEGQVLVHFCSFVPLNALHTLPQPVGFSNEFALVRSLISMQFVLSNTRRLHDDRRTFWGIVIKYQNVKENNFKT